MSNTVTLNRYRDFDRLLFKKNLFVTIIGSALAFVLSYYEEAILQMEDISPPYGLSLTIGIIVFVGVYTRNIASASFVALVGGLGIVSPRGGEVDFALGYIVILLILSVLVGYLADRLRLVLTWVNFYLYSALLFGIIMVGMSLYFSTLNESSLYDPLNYGRGLDLGTTGDYQIFDFALLGVLVVIFLILKLLTRGQIVLDSASVGKYKIFGALLFLTGQVIGLVTLLFATGELSQSQAESIARTDKHLLTIQDLLSHQEAGRYYGFVLEPLSVFAVISISVMLISGGISFWIIGQNHGNIEGMRGGSNTIFMTVPIGMLAFLIVGSYYLQNLLYPGGYFISEELLPIYLTMIWSVLFLNQLIGWIVLVIINKIIKSY